MTNFISEFHLGFIIHFIFGLLETQITHIGIVSRNGTLFWFYILYRNEEFCRKWLVHTDMKLLFPFPRHPLPFLFC